MKHKFEIVIPPAMEFLILVRRTIRDLGFLFSFPEMELEKVVMASDEACTNSIRNTLSKSEGIEGRISISIEISEEAYVVAVCDCGDDFREEFERGVSLSERVRSMQVSGYGIPMIKQIMDLVEYEHHPKKGNRLCMTKYSLTPSQPDLPFQ